MPERTGKIRLYLDAPLGEGETLRLDKGQSHYLRDVMRQGPGAVIKVFNGKQGEWQAEITAASKRETSVRIIGPTAPQSDPPDLWLLFAPVKKARTDFIVEKATELGVARILPVLTRFTNADRVRVDRLQAHVVEAAEQCGATHVPTVADPMKLTPCLSGLSAERRILFCDEGRSAPAVHQALAGAQRGPWAILVGPEGGFAPDEVTALQNMPQTTAVTLGPRILRADTAVVAAITAWQQALGDW